MTLQNTQRHNIRDMEIWKTILFCSKGFYNFQKNVLAKVVQTCAKDKLHTNKTIACPNVG
ncbi:hypothetical protein CHS0354_027809, partial [Potamilus streckersoni]